MKLLRIASIFLLALVPTTLLASSGATIASTTLSNLEMLITQYEGRIKQLEAENNVLRNEMVKAGIKIPLADYSGAIASPLISNPIVLVPSPQTSTGAITLPVVTTPAPSTPLSEIETKHGKDIALFINKINADWKSIIDFYKLDTGARIAGYEFVSTGSSDHVFVDIVIGTGTVGIYDMKILYQYEKTAYKRKLIGMFDYIASASRYTTRPGGSNPFPGVARVFIRDPYYVGTFSVPLTVTSTPSPVTNTGTTTQPSSNIEGGDVSPILRAYSEKKYLTTITLSNTYLEKYPPTVEILNIRYRTFFIIGKFSESLAELAKIESLGGLDRQTACNAQVIATYSKSQTLISKYTSVCKK